MGDYSITISGTGPHHNKDHDGDADRVADDAVRKLEESGHTIHAARITYGCADDLRHNSPADS